jgi:hypothetical protein
MNYKVGQPTRWIEIENDHSQTGHIPTSTDPNSKLYQALVGTHDARLTEQILIEDNVDPILAVRGLLYRGRLAEATELIASLKNNSSVLPEQICELLIEQARLAAFNGDWNLSFQYATEAFHLSPTPLSRMTIYQIRALATFELGNFMAVVSDLNHIDTLADLFPKAPSLFYSRILETRLMARDISPFEGLEALKQLWQNLIS